MAAGLPELLESVGSPFDVIADRARAFVENRDRWADEFPGMMASFAHLKQDVHLMLRHISATESVYGGGFLRLFTG